MRNAWKISPPHLNAANASHSSMFPMMMVLHRKKSVAAMHGPFLVLKHCGLISMNNSASMSVLPDTFWGGSAPHLDLFELCEPFPTFPNFVLSSAQIKHLSLADISDSAGRHQIIRYYQTAHQSPRSSPTLGTSNLRNYSDTLITCTIAAPLSGCQTKYALQCIHHPAFRISDLSLLLSFDSFSSSPLLWYLCSAHFTKLSFLPPPDFSNCLRPGSPQYYPHYSTFMDDSQTDASQSATRRELPQFDGARIKDDELPVRLGPNRSLSGSPSPPRQIMVAHIHVCFASRCCVKSR
jgi:hypothetical protein